MVLYLDLLYNRWCWLNLWLLLLNFHLDLLLFNRCLFNLLQWHLIRGLKPLLGILSLLHLPLRILLRLSTDLNGLVHLQNSGELLSTSWERHLDLLCVLVQNLIVEMLTLNIVIVRLQKNGAGVTIQFRFEHLIILRFQRILHHAERKVLSGDVSGQSFGTLGAHIAGGRLELVVFDNAEIN